MKLSQHLDKGLWAGGVQALVALYGLALMLLVVRILPEEQYGHLVLIQTLFLVIAHLGNSLAFGPMVKYFSDISDRRALLSNAFLLGFLWFAFWGVTVWLLRAPLATLFNAGLFVQDAYFVPLLLMLSLGKFFTNQVLRGVYRIREIFWSQLAYHGLATGLMVWLVLRGAMQRATDMLMVLCAALALQSLVGAWLARSHMRELRPRVDRAVLKRLFDFGKFNLGTAVNLQLVDRLDVFMIAAFVGPLEVALYFSAQQFMRIVGMYRQMVGLLALPAFSKLNSQRRLDDVKALFEKGVFMSHLIMLPLCAGLIVFARPFYELFYGGKYLDGVHLLQLLALTAPLIIWPALGEGLLNGLGYPARSFRARTTTTVVKLGLNVLLILLFQATGAVLATVLATGLLAVLISHDVRQHVPFHLRCILGRYRDVKNFLNAAKVQWKGVIGS